MLGVIYLGGFFAFWVKLKGDKFGLSRIFFPLKCSCPKVSQPNIHNIPIDHWRLSLSFCFLLQIELHSHRLGCTTLHGDPLGQRLYLPTLPDLQLLKMTWVAKSKSTKCIRRPDGSPCILVHATIIITCRVDMTRASKCHYEQFPCREEV